MRTVKDVAELSGVSIRTLRYYDEIGLLKPVQLSEAGYRLYDDAALEKLQQIRFFRELDIPLTTIMEALHTPDYDKQQVLASQKCLLERKRDRLNGIIELISDVMNGVNTMRFDAFEENDYEAIVDHTIAHLTDEFRDLLEKKHGSIEGYRAACLTLYKSDKGKKGFAKLLRYYGSKEKAMSFLQQEPRGDIGALQQEISELMKQLAALKGKEDVEAEKPLICRLAEIHKVVLCLDNARAILLDTAKGYTEDEMLQKGIEKLYGQGSAAYFAEAIERYYGV